MKSWIRSGVLTMVFLLICLIVIFIGYRDYLYELLFEDYHLFEDDFAYTQEANYALDLDYNPFENLAIDRVHEMYITVLEMNALSFTDYINQRDDRDIKLYDVYFYDGQKQILDGGIFVREANGEIRLKGNNPFNDVQKSFKIQLFNNEGLWQKQQEINLEKQEADPLRIRNKLALDMMQDIRHLLSLNTAFTRVYIKDLHGNKEYMDYGLFVQVEHVDDLYLINRGINPNGYLYEVDNFRFKPTPLDVLEDDDDVITKGDRSDEPFNQFVSDVNNGAVSTSVLIKTYFDEDHLLNWMAFNILIGNKNVVERDYFLYTSKVSDKWYFIPDDMDASFGRIAKAPQWKLGIGNYYNNSLFKRILLDEVYRNKLVERVDAMAEIMTPTYVKAYLDLYYDEFFSNIMKDPDYAGLEYPFDTFKDTYYDLADYPEEMYQLFKRSLNYPMPFKADVDVEPTGVRISDLDSAMLNGQAVTYDVQISRQVDMTEIVYSETGLTGNHLVSNLIPGIYYVKVVARGDGYAQEMTNIYEDDFGRVYPGLERIEIE